MKYKLVELEVVNCYKHPPRGEEDTILIWVNTDAIVDVLTTCKEYYGLLLIDESRVAINFSKEELEQVVRSEVFEVNIPVEDLMYVEYWEHGENDQFRTVCNRDPIDMFQWIHTDYIYENTQE